MTEVSVLFNELLWKKSNITLKDVFFVLNISMGVIWPPAWLLCRSHADIQYSIMST